MRGLGGLEGAHGAGRVSRKDGVRPGREKVSDREEGTQKEKGSCRLNV